MKSRSAPKPRVNDGLKMRASVRMTRYLESWGAVKPFSHLQNREGFPTDTIVNGKPRCRVSMHGGFQLLLGYGFNYLMIIISTMTCLCSIMVNNNEALPHQ